MEKSVFLWKKGRSLFHVLLKSHVSGKKRQRAEKAQLSLRDAIAKGNDPQTRSALAEGTEKKTGDRIIPTNEIEMDLILEVSI